MDIFGLPGELALGPLTTFVTGTTTGCSARFRLFIPFSDLNFLGSAIFGLQIMMQS